MHIYIYTLLRCGIATLFSHQFPGNLTPDAISPVDYISHFQTRWLVFTPAIKSRPFVSDTHGLCVFWFANNQVGEYKQLLLKADD